jgi:alanyl-tRNA synthetase
MLLATIVHWPFERSFHYRKLMLLQVRTRGLPDDHKGAVRVVTIEGVESNMCCGTHVTNLSQLQAVKLLRTEKGKKNKTNLYFLVGGRVLQQLSACLHREHQLTALLKYARLTTVH